MQLDHWITESQASHFWNVQFEDETDIRIVWPLKKKLLNGTATFCGSFKIVSEHKKCIGKISRKNCFGRIYASLMNRQLQNRYQQISIHFSNQHRCRSEFIVCIRDVPGWFFITKGGGVERRNFHFDEKKGSN